MLFDSYAAHLQKLAPWMKRSYELELESVSSTPLPADLYDAEEFGNVDITFRHQPLSDDEPTDFSAPQPPTTQVTTAEYLSYALLIDNDNGPQTY